MQTIGSQPFGQDLLALVGIGLLGYALWRWTQAAFDPEGRGGTEASDVARRIGYACSGGIHGALAIAAFQMSWGSSGGGGSKQTYVAQLLAAPFGAWLLGIVGASVIGAGVYQLRKAYKMEFEKHYRTYEMSSAQRRWAIRLGRIGLTARGIVFQILGLFLIQAALQHDPSEVKGMGGALREIASQSYGPWLLALVAMGLAAYGVHMLVNARFRSVPSRK